MVNRRSEVTDLDLNEGNLPEQDKWTYLYGMVTMKTSLSLGGPRMMQDKLRDAPVVSHQ